MKSIQFFKEFVESSHPKKGYLVIRISNEFVEQSIQLPPLTRSTIYCYTPYHYRLVDSAIPPSVRPMLHAGDITGVLQTLGVSSHTSQTLPDAVCSYRQNEIENLESQLANTSVPHSQEFIEHTRIRIQHLHEQIQSIRTNLQSISTTNCSICYELPSCNIILPCCSNLFCGPCILQWATQSNQCPLCRSMFRSSDLLHYTTTPSQEPPKQILKKIDTLFQILRDFPNGQFIIVSRFENPFDTIQNQLQELQISVSFLQGNKDGIANILQDFEEKKIRVLLLSSKNDAMGMNIHSATHIILLHKMTDDETSQIIGRAYRLGRTLPLHCIQLLNEGE
jgi:hypothetical protein